MKKAFSYPSTPEGCIVNTITGPKQAESLGVILPNEHLMIDCTSFYTEPEMKIRNRLTDRISLKGLATLRRHPYCIRENLRLDSEVIDNILEDLKLFKVSGGKTIVDNTAPSMRSENALENLEKLSKESDVNIIIGTGFYREEIEKQASTKTQEEIYLSMKQTLEEGFLSSSNSTTYKPAFIGEITCSWPLKDFEKKVLRAVGDIQENARYPVSIHAGMKTLSTMQALRFYQEAGGRDENVAVCHLDRTMKEMDIIDFFDTTKCYCQFSNFGTEGTCYLGNEYEMLSDSERIECISYFKKYEQLHRVLLSHDVHTRHRLIPFGGHGLSHITNNVLPFMKHKEFTEFEINMVIATNPQRWLVCG